MAALLLTLPVSGWAATFDSLYTKLSLDPAECPAVLEDEESGSAVYRCPGVAGYHLLVEYGDDRMSATLEGPDGSRSPLNLWDYVSHAFSSLGDTAEWRVVKVCDKIQRLAKKFWAAASPGRGGYGITARSHGGSSSRSLRGA